MSEKLLLPREWTQKSIAPVWKWAAVAGWAMALVLAQCLVIVLVWPGGRPTTATPPLAETPPAALAPRNHGQLDVARSLSRIRCLVAVGRSQEALAETIRCLTLCQRLEVDPPADLPALFAQTVTSISSQPAESPVRPHPRPRPAQPAPPPAPPEPTYPSHPVTCSAGRLPGPGYPQAAPRPRLAQLPPVSGAYPFMPPPPPPENSPVPAPPQPGAGRYEFQPPHGLPPFPGY